MYNGLSVISMFELVRIIYPSEIFLYIFINIITTIVISVTIFKILVPFVLLTQEMSV